MTTNQKVAGSSPAERAIKCPANRRIFRSLEPLFVRAYRLSDHLQGCGTRLTGTDRAGAPAPQPFGEAAHRILLDVWEYAGVDVHGYVDAGVPENLLQDLNRLLTLEPEGREGVPQGCRASRLPGARPVRLAA